MSNKNMSIAAFKNSFETTLLNCVEIIYLFPLSPHT